MTRFGVMKHLKVLEEAGLVVARKRGREKLHFLNPVPIRLIHDRWVSKYAEPWASRAHRAQDPTGGHAMTTDVTTVSFARGTAPVAGHRSVRDLHQGHPGTHLGGDHRPRAAREVQLRGADAVGLGDRVDVPRGRARRLRHRRGREPRRRATPAARPVLQRPVERRGQGAGNHPGHLGDRAGGRLLPADGRARPAPGQRERRAVRRLADDPLRPEDAAGDRRAAHHTRLADVQRRWADHCLLFRRLSESVCSDARTTAQPCTPSSTGREM